MLDCEALSLHVITCGLACFFLFELTSPAGVFFYRLNVIAHCSLSDLSTALLNELCEQLLLY